MILPIPPSEESLKMLLRAKLMLSHALEHASQQTEIDNMNAVLGFDNTIENLLICVSSALDLESITGKRFDIINLSGLAASISKTLNEYAGIRLSYLGDIKLLRKTRNLVQHGAIAPYADLERFSKITEKFFNNTLKKVFGFNLKDLQISAGIEDEDVKTFLKKAEKEIESENWLDSIISSRNAFENEYSYRIRQAGISLSLYPNLVSAKLEDEFSIYGFETIKEELELTYLGINNSDYRHFKEYLRHIPSEYCADDIGPHTIMQRDWVKEDAIFCYNFAANTILRWQAKEKQKLYTPKFTKEYRFDETIAGIKISKESEAGCIYYYNDDNRFYLFYSSKRIKKRFEKLKIGAFYNYKTVNYVNGKKEKVYEETIELIGKYMFLVTNEPEKWGIIIRYRNIEKKA